MATHLGCDREGEALPPLDKEPGVTQLVKYAAGSGDFNPLHHDYQFPQSKQIGSIIVHGRFKYAALGELVSNWLGHDGRIQKISCQYRGMDLPNQPIVPRHREAEVGRGRQEARAGRDLDREREGQEDDAGRGDRRLQLVARATASEPAG